MCVRAHACALLLEVDSQSQPPPPPCINLLQTKTKRTQRRGFSACLPFLFFFFFCFQGCQPLLFKDLTLALQSNKKPFGKLIRLGKLFRFLMQLRWQKFNIPLARTGESRRKCASSPVSRRRPEDLCWSRCKQEVLAFHPAGSPDVDVLLFFDVTAQATRFMSGV